MDAIAGLFIMLYLMVWCGLLFALLGYCVVAYILEAKALSAIARRRGIQKPWLAWVPVGAGWLLGCISDQYRYVARGQVRNRRKLLTGLSVGMYAVLALFFTVLFVWIIRSLASLGTDAEAFMVTYLSNFWFLYLITWVSNGVLAVYSVFMHMAYYDLYRSCDPKKSLVYLLVGIFVSYALPFFLYSCRNKDLGMPPRKDQQEAPAEQ